MITPDTALSPELELDAGFRAAKDWFFANEDEEGRERAGARAEDGPTSPHSAARSVRKDLLRPGEAADRRKAGRRGRLE